MKKILLLAALIFLAGCAATLTNDIGEQCSIKCFGECSGTMEGCEMKKGIFSMPNFSYDK